MGEKIKKLQNGWTVVFRGWGRAHEYVWYIETFDHLSPEYDD